ncbi:Flp family type IVb pilin [Modicisalibacter xianhensis]|uniref:Flp pilus assembly protein, pilin Flp n=1 Tax=Modicisalibacter xianhensis TaxID=442341 RepID=A0A1I2ZLU8_9GAMM|nr:hypothetical protein [Halomonas xianhensis]SFH38793.1 Flp pilus assembly protein, pilin Flp [Halomonas xianhensis]
MNKLMMGVKKFLRDEEGTEVVEWALVAGLIVAVGAGIFWSIGDAVSVHLNSLLEALGGEAGTTKPA